MIILIKIALIVFFVIPIIGCCTFFVLAADRMKQEEAACQGQDH